MERSLGVFRILGTLTILFFAAGASPAPDPSIPKLAIPDIAAQRTARSRVNETFADEIAKAKKPGEKTAMARKLLQTADDTGNDASVKYVALTMARDLALADADAETAFAAIAGLELYAIDGVKLKSDTLIAIMKSTRSPQDALVGAVVEQAIGIDRFPVARQLAETALATAKVAGDAGAIGNANAWILEIREVEAASSAASKAASVLAAKRDDPAASATVGRFEAFFKNHWEKGLGLLAGANDVTLKTLAEIELAKTTDPAKEMQVADGWWAISMKEKGIARSHIREHAAHWYKAAVPKLTGLEKARAENRAKEAGVVRVTYTGWIDLLRKVNIEHDVIKGKFSLERGVLSMSARAELKISPKPEKGYAVRVEFVRPDASENSTGFIVILPVAETQVNLVIEPKRMGLDIVDGKRAMWGDTLKAGDFGGAGKKHLVEVTVSQEAPDASILVLVDGKRQLEWKGSPSRLTNTGDFTMHPAALGIGSWDTSLKISAIALREGND
jgi:hypothetical protein